MMHNMFSDFDDFSYAGHKPQPIYRRCSILSNCEGTMTPDYDQLYKPVTFIPDDSFDAQQDDCYAKKQVAQMEWKEKHYRPVT
jgi:hypothetical protein